jgi:hypothetical protein
VKLRESSSPGAPAEPRPHGAWGPPPLPSPPGPQVRQLGHPALLAAQYSGNTPAVAAAAVKELEEALVRSREDWKNHNLHLHACAYRAKARSACAPPRGCLPPPHSQPPSRGARVPLAARAPALRPPPTPRRGSPFSP